MKNINIVRYSKFLSLHLRHAPHRIGLTLDSAGWCSVEELLDACDRNGMPITRTELDTIVTENDKQRFAFSEDGTRIRASQGHSIAVDLELTPIRPPDELFHGTGAASVESILTDGLRKRRRHHVHLTDDTETARRVGARHGKPVVLRVDAGAMQQAGHRYFRSENGVYLTDTVPARFLAVLAE